MKNETTGCLEYVELDLKECTSVNTSLSGNMTNTLSVSKESTLAITSTTTATTTKTTGLELSTVDTRIRIASKDIQNSTMDENDDEREGQVSQIMLYFYFFSNSRHALFMF